MNLIQRYLVSRAENKTFYFAYRSEIIKLAEILAKHKARTEYEQDYDLHYVESKTNNRQQYTKNNRSYNIP